MTPLLLKYLNSVKVFEGPNDQGTPKPTIHVESVDNRGKKEGTLDPNERVEEEVEEEKDEEEQEEEDDENETAEEKAARIIQEKEDRRQSRIQKRIDKLTAVVGTKDAEIELLKKQLAEKPVEGLTEEEVERRAAKKAEDLANAKEVDREQKAFAKIADTLIKGASKVDKDFEKKINEVAKETDTLMPKYMVEILADIDNGSELLAQMANDEDLYEEICTLSERQMTRRLDKMSDKMKEDKKKAPVRREVRLPDPIEPISDGGNNRGNNLPSKPTQNMDEYVRVRALQEEAYRKAHRR